MKTTPLAEKLPNTIDPSLDLEQVKKNVKSWLKTRQIFCWCCHRSCTIF